MILRYNDCWKWSNDGSVALPRRYACVDTSIAETEEELGNMARKDLLPALLPEVYAT